MLLTNLSKVAESYFLKDFSMVNKISGTQSDILKPSNDVEIGLIGACANKWEASAKTKKMTHFGFFEKSVKTG